jgi:hypothetical protein
MTNKMILNCYCVIFELSFKIGGKVIIVNEITSFTFLIQYLWIVRADMNIIDNYYNIKNFIYFNQSITKFILFSSPLLSSVIRL